MTVFAKLQRRTLLLALLIISAATVSACGPDSSEIASKVAKDWVNAPVKSVSSEIAKAVVGDNKFLAALASGIIESQINNTVEWRFSQPEEMSKNRYRVIASADSNIGVSVPLFSDKNYDVGVDFVLDIDTSSRKVVSAPIDISSLRIVER